MKDNLNFVGKKLLVLGGSYQHIKIVEAAKKLGIITYVTDYLPIEKSPAKAIADYALMYNITDIDNLVQFCQKEMIDGVIAPYLDVTQLPYQQLCEKMNYFCFGNKEQHKNLTDKILFKDFCLKHGADIIETYSMDDILNNKKSINFPVLVKPNDSRGSRGQTICNNFDEIFKAIEFAKHYSSSKEIIIEKYLTKSNDVEMAYFIVEEEPLFIRMLDRYVGSKEKGFDKLAIAEIYPSKVYNKDFDGINDKITKFLKNFRLKNAPIFLQAFVDSGMARLYDPGIRFPGDNFDLLFREITNINMPEIFVIFALTGQISKDFVKKINNINSVRPAALIMPCLRSGQISEIKGLDEIKNNPNIISFSKAYNVGDIVVETKDVRQRFGEFCIIGSDFKELQNTINSFFNNLQVLNEQGQDMLIEKFDITKLNEYMAREG